jgi:D-sedoheptulose 7-phosphate isomerase
MKNCDDVLHAKQYFEELQRVVADLPHDSINQIAEALLNAYESEQSLYLFGNGGSASLASHFACDLGKGTAYCNGGKRFRVLALTDNLATLTAWANDSGYQDIFSEQLKNFVRPHDVTFAISASGNSTNVLNGLRIGREAGARTIGIAGFDGGKMKSMCDICAVVPSDNMQIIEDLHLAMAHSIYRIVHSRITRRTLAATCPA